MLPARLLEVQTAFFRWADARHGDLHDEHTYDNSNRWVGYLADLQRHLETLPSKPFVMGETVLFTSWPDIEGIDRIGVNVRSGNILVRTDKFVNLLHEAPCNSLHFPTR